MNKRLGLIAAIITAFLLTGCVNTAPIITDETAPDKDGRVVINTSRPVEDETGYAEPTAEATPEAGVVDDLGNVISGPEHFTRYLTFRTMLVYEEDMDTFLDGIILNTYTQPITCAIDIVYTSDEGEQLAKARLQTRDGKYLLVLEPGENVIFAHILTDMTLTEMPYEMVFDKDVGIKPLG